MATVKDPGTRDQADDSAVVRGWPAWAAGVLVLLVAVLSVLHTAVAPEPRPADAPAAEFSATRAYAELARIAQRPHPAGSPANEQVRDRLVARLTELGLRPQVQRSSAGVPDADSSHAFGWVQNVHATLPGTANAGRVLLVAHYDSVEIGPGASDDGVGVATLLEIARAVTEMPRPRAEITFLFTDSEEFGLLGARAFVAAGLAGDPTRDVVLNLDTRGTTGRTIMFETGAHSTALMPAVRAGSPLLTSVSREVYRLLPNETDFTAFRAASYTGLNFAMVDGSARYHSEQDDLSHVDSASLQDMGRTVLETTRTLATDPPGPADAGESVYFTVFGLVVDYSTGAVLPLGALALLAAATAVWFARRRGRLRLRSAARVAATAPLVPVGGAAIGWLGWQAVVLAGPHNDRFLGGDPYAVVPARTGLALLVVVLAALWLLWVSRRARPAEIAAGGVLITAVLAAVSAVLLPGAAYLFTWPALAASTGLAVAARLPENSPWASAVAWLAAVPTVLLTVPLVWLLFGTVGLALAGAPLLLLGLAAVTVLPARRTRRHTGTVLAVVAVLAVGMVVAGTAANAPSAQDPAQASLVYALDADRREAVWASEGDGSGDWAHDHAPTDDPDLEERFPALLSAAEGTRSGPAPVVAVPEATMTVTGETTEGELRHLRLRISPTARPTQLALYADAGGAPVERAELAGTTFPGGSNRPVANTTWHWGLLLSAPPPEGFDLTLTVRGSTPARLLLVAQGNDFPLSASTSPRPDTVRWGGYASGLTFAARSYRL